MYNEAILSLKGFFVQNMTRLKSIGLCLLFLFLIINAVVLLFALPHSSSSQKIDAQTPLTVASGTGSTSPQEATPAVTPLKMVDLPSAVNSGACMVWENFGSGAQRFSMAKALLLTGPLKNKSWTLESAIVPTWDLKVTVNDRLAVILGEVAMPAPDRHTGRSLTWVFEDEAKAIAMAQTLKSKGALSSVSKTVQENTSQRLILLPQGPVEVAYTRSLMTRMANSELSAVTCPPEAVALLEGKQVASSAH